MGKQQPQIDFELQKIIYDTIWNSNIPNIENAENVNKLSYEIEKAVSSRPIHIKSVCDCSNPFRGAEVDGVRRCGLCHRIIE